MKYLMKLNFFTESKKYIKTYENTDDKNFWLVPTGPKLSTALKKIGGDLKYAYDLRHQTRPIYFGIDQYKNCRWEFFDNGFSIFLDDEYTYQGSVKVEDWEIDANKYNL